jgi:hypothetical protein
VRAQERASGLRYNLLMFSSSDRLIIQELTEILDSTTSVGASLEHQESECKPQTNSMVPDLELRTRLRGFLNRYS